METSDSEYFESADEDFESDDEFNKNKILVKNNSEEHKINDSKNVNTVHSSDVNQNKEESTDCGNVNQDEINFHSSDRKNVTIEDHKTKIFANKGIGDRSSDSLKVTQDTNINLQSVVMKNNPSENHGIKTFVSPEICNKTNDCRTVTQGNNMHLQSIVTKSDMANEDNITQVSVDTKIIDRSSIDKIDTIETDDNLWNEGEGWGVDEDENDLESDMRPQKKIDFSNSTLTDNKAIKLKENIMSRSEIQEEKSPWDSEEWETWESVNEEHGKVNNTKLDVDSSSSSSNANQIWKGWGNWGVTSILSTATQSVSTLTNSVSQGLSTVLESGIGAPDPEKLAMLNKTEGNLLSSEVAGNVDEESENKNLLGFGLSNIGHLVSGVSKLVESTSTKVISGGLDTLETIGKKTMEVIQDGDPGLKRKRAFLNLEGDKPILSQILREAKEKAEQENRILQAKHSARKVNYESIFDDHQGLVHLEALEMLSKQCDMKLQLLIESSSGSSLVEIQETLDQIKELCELPDEEDDEQISLDELKNKLKSAVDEIGINITYEKLISMWEETECWLNNLNLNICDENEIHESAVETLAQLTAIAVEQFHKGGELLLIKDHHSTADEADSLVQLTTTLTSLIGIVAAKFSDKMNAKATENSDKEKINSLITNIFFEAANSSSYIQDAFQLLVPVIQMGAV